MLPPISGGALDSDPPSPETEGRRLGLRNRRPLGSRVHRRARRSRDGLRRAAARGRKGVRRGEPARRPATTCLSPRRSLRRPTAAGPIGARTRRLSRRPRRRQSVSPGDRRAGQRPAADLAPMSAEPAPTGDHLPVPSAEVDAL